MGTQLPEHCCTILGDEKVGKSALITRLCRDTFEESYDPTIENTYRMKRFFRDSVYTLDVLDTSGNEYYSSLLEQWYRGFGAKHGYILVYSITSASSFCRVEHYHRGITQNFGEQWEQSPIVLVANKMDRAEEREVSHADGTRLAHKLGCYFVEASAKEGTGVDAIFDYLADALRVQNRPAGRYIKSPRTPLVKRIRDVLQLPHTRPRRQTMHNQFLDWLQPRPAPGYVRISWTCRCGKRVNIRVDKEREVASTRFAAAAAGRSNSSSISVTSSSQDSLKDTSSATQETSDMSQDTESGQEGKNSLDGSAGYHGDANPFIPAGMKKFILLCVNSPMGPIKLQNVDVTDIEKDEELFRCLRSEYRRCRGGRKWSPFTRPKTMHYIKTKFHLLHLSKTKDCVGNYRTNSIPTRKEILSQEYAFRPCPPPHGDVPIHSELFMHVFLNPGDHLGSLAVEMLPKKLRERLCWDDAANNMNNLPYGWGFYIVEDVDWVIVTTFVLGILFAVTALTIAWSMTKGDVQEGTGIGQYCIAVVAVLICLALRFKD